MGGSDAPDVTDVDVERIKGSGRPPTARTDGWTDEWRDFFRERRTRVARPRPKKGGGRPNEWAVISCR